MNSRSDFSELRMALTQIAASLMDIREEFLRLNSTLESFKVEKETNVKEVNKAISEHFKKVKER